MSPNPKMDPTPEEIEKILEEARMKTVPPHILKGFKDDVMRRIESESERRAKPGRWFGADFKLPRVGMSVGFGALACLLVASLAVFTMDKPRSATPAQTAALSDPSRPAAVSGGVFDVAMLPDSSTNAMIAPSARAFDKMVVSPAGTTRAAVTAAKPAVAKRAKLTVEEELRLIEEFDDQKFFIRQDITEDDLASA